MIVVLGSRHDPVAGSLVDEWSDACMCSAKDLTTEGWRWSPTGAMDPVWVVDGSLVADRDVDGVFLCRRAFYAEEFPTTNTDDRAYLAAESHAFMADVLASTSATVAQPVGDGTFGDELLRPDRWIAAAASTGLAVAPIRLGSRVEAYDASSLRSVEVVGDVVLGDVSEEATALLIDLASGLGVGWLTVAVDHSERVHSLTSSAAPSTDARAALESYLLARGAR
jgi:hypothetical protein